MRECTDNHKLELRGVSHNGRSYRFRCRKCFMRVIIYKKLVRRMLVDPQLHWLPMPLYIPRKES